MLLTNKPNRHEYRFPGMIRVIIGFQPWHLIVTMAGLSLSEAEVTGEIRFGNDQIYTMNDIKQMLPQGNQCHIQLEYQHDTLPSPVIPVSVKIVEDSPNGCRAIFIITETNDDFKLLHTEIKNADHH